MYYNGIFFEGLSNEIKFETWAFRIPNRSAIHSTDGQLFSGKNYVGKSREEQFLRNFHTEWPINKVICWTCAPSDACSTSIAPGRVTVDLASLGADQNVAYLLFHPLLTASLNN